jgi:hypothetical protein
MSNEQNIRGVSRDRTKPSPGQQGEYVPTRFSRYGELIASPLSERQRLSEEGSSFIAHNPTNDAATTLAGHVAPVLADADDTMTKPFIFIRVPANATKLVYLDFIELECVVIGASGTEDNWADQLDTGTTRLSSGGTALTIVNPNMQSTETSILATTNHLLGGAVVSAAESASVRHLGHGQLSDTIMVAGDRYLFTYGHTPSLGTVDRHVVNRPAVILGATDQYLLALYAPSQAATAAVYKVRIGWFERERT